MRPTWYARSSASQQSSWLFPTLTTHFGWPELRTSSISLGRPSGPVADRLSRHGSCRQIVLGNYLRWDSRLIFSTQKSRCFISLAPAVHRSRTGERVRTIACSRVHPDRRCRLRACLDHSRRRSLRRYSWATRRLDHRTALDHGDSPCWPRCPNGKRGPPLRPMFLGYEIRLLQSPHHNNIWVRPKVTFECDARGV